MGFMREHYFYLLSANHSDSDLYLDSNSFEEDDSVSKATYEVTAIAVLRYIYHIRFIQTEWVQLNHFLQTPYKRAQAPRRLQHSTASCLGRGDKDGKHRSDGS